MRSTFFIKRAYINFLRNWYNNFSSIINVAVVSFFSIFLLFILKNSVEFIEQIVSKNSAAIILKTEASKENISGVEALIRGEKSIEKYTYISPSSAFEELKKNFSINTESAAINPDSILPHIFEIKFSRYIDKETYNRFVTSLKKMESFEDFRINESFLELFFRLKKYSIYFRIAIFLILCISSFYILSNTIGLNLHNNRREEIELVELLGGDYLDIRLPYIFEGMLIVGIGFMLGLLIAISSFYMLLPALNKFFNMGFISFEPVMIGMKDIIIIFVILIMSGLLGIIRFIRRFIKGLYDENI